MLVRVVCWFRRPERRPVVSNAPPTSIARPPSSRRPMSRHRSSKVIVPTRSRTIRRRYRRQNAPPATSLSLNPPSRKRRTISKTKSEESTQLNTEPGTIRGTRTSNLASDDRPPRHQPPIGKRMDQTPQLILDVRYGRNNLADRAVVALCQLAPSPGSSCRH